MIPRIAVLTFPGNNCENETVRALSSVGFVSQKIRWNEDSSIIASFDGVVIPGGFSFEDRGRSGIISAQEPVFETLKAMAHAGKPIMGICNGAQMLVESGLILETPEGIPALALLRNKRINKKGEILGTGFYHSWRTIRPVHTKTPFSNFDHAITVPIAHGEGRFTVPEHLQDAVRNNALVVFEYVDEMGMKDPHYPTNPNGSFENAAAMCNPTGNVMAIMPHPERCAAGKIVFESLWNFFQNPWELNATTLTVPSFPSRTLIPKKLPSLRVFVSLRITDNTEKTFSQVLGTAVTRYEVWDIDASSLSLENIEQLFQSNELINIQKQSAMFLFENAWYSFSKEDGILPLEKGLENVFLVQEKEDFTGQYTTHHLSHQFPNFGIQLVSFGVAWKVFGKSTEEVIKNPIFASYVGEEVYDME